MKGLQRSIWVLTGLVVGVACLWVWGPVSLQAGAITVCPVGCDYDTVQGAVNAAASFSTILISPATYTETVIITKSLTLEGVGQPQPVVSGNDAGRPFTILGSVTVTMTDITVTRGRAPVDPDGSARGGGIFNQGQLTLDHVIISHNQAIGLAGQAPEAEGGLAYGGGIYSECVPALADCFDVSLTAVTVISNTAKGGVGAVGGDAYGGGIAKFCETTTGSVDCGSLTILDSRFGFNQAWGGQGGDSLYPSHWGAPGGQAFGGGISNACIDYRCGAVELTRSEIHHNKARGGDSGDGAMFPPPPPTDGFGGGIHTNQRPFIRASHIHHNQAHTGAYYPGSHGPYPDSVGGGVYMLLTSPGIPGGIEYSTIDNNKADAGGGVFIAFSSLSIFNSTISQNVARVCGAGVLHATFEDSLFDYVTITENVVLDPPYSVGNSSSFCKGTGGGSGIYRSQWADNRFPSLKNSLLVNNWGYGDPHADCYGTIFSRGFNYTTTCTLVGNLNGTILNQPIILGSLQDNGGLTLTHALLTGSLAIDAAAPTDCPNTDQRHFARWVDGNGDGIEQCDMGAYEYGGTPTDVGMVGEIRGRAPFSLLIPSLLGLTACLVLWVWQKQKGT